MPNKITLRNRMLERRNNLTKEAQQQASQDVCKQLANHSAFIKAGTVGSYMAHENEINPFALTHDFPDKTWAFPRVEPKRHLSFVTHTPGDPVIKNRYGILEPSNEAIVLLELIDVLLLPLLAFDQRGHRLGFGAGYYDRYLTNNNKHPMLIGLAYPWQEVARVPNDPWDIALDDIVISTAGA